MKRPTNSRRRPAIHITLSRAARLHRLVLTLAQNSQTREDLLRKLGIGLRTFYRELELLRRCGVKVRLTQKRYSLVLSAREAEGRLPFPDPQLSFAEMAELARAPGAAAQRLAALLQSVVSQASPSANPQKPRRNSKRKAGRTR